MSKIKFEIKPISLAIAVCFSGAAAGQDTSPVKDIGVIVITSGQSSSLPTQIPTTMESVTAKQLAETINATELFAALTSQVASISEGNGQISSYASTLISTYQTFNVEVLVTQFLNLDDTVRR